MLNIDLQYIASLSKLELEPTQKEYFENKIYGIIRMIEEMPEVSSNFTAEVSNNFNLREDEIKKIYSRDQLLDNAPKSQAGCFAVPKIID